MKKILALSTCVFVLMAGVAFGTTLTPVSTKAATGAIIDAKGAASVDNFFKFSKGVYVGAEYNGQGYALATAHTNGSKYYGTGFDATAIYAKDAGGVVGTTLAAPSSSVTTEAFTTADGWSQL